ncbi:MAG: phosphatidylserine/phosphatidylglycerophosphate/cardiolipin synthase family protein [Myxococcota bacterium]|nr:phosphatidylserine/phosphatidylglycerophosphate/cardiolipin synthase family protein [Myxococcota bacterium]
MKLTGVELDDIENASLELRIPLKSGYYSLPTENYSDARVSIEPGSSISVSVELQRHDGVLLITKADLRFSRDIRIHNPASALEPSNTGLLDWDILSDSFSDMAADALLRRVFMNELGEIHATGEIDLPWFLDDTPLDRIVKTTSPRVDETFLELPEFASIPALLRVVGGMTSEGTYQASLWTRPLSLGLEGEVAELRSGEEPIDVLIQGKARVRRNGTIHIDVEKNNEAEIMTGAGNLDFNGSIDLAIDRDANVLSDADLDFRTAISNIRGKVEPQPGVRVPINFVFPDSVAIEGRTGVSLRDGKVTLDGGRFKTSVTNYLSDDRLSAGSARMRLDDGVVKVDATGNFEYAADNIKVNNLNAEAEIRGKDGYVTLEGLRLKIDGYLKTQLEIRNARLNSKEGIAEGVGHLGYELDPRATDTREELDLGIFRRDVDFDLKPNGDLVVDPGTSGLADFFAPFLSLSGNPDKLVSASGEGVGAVGNPEFQAHIETVSNTKTLKNNKVELLIDGVESYPRRLELIQNAKESICLQTLIFKFDETGKETGQALVDAVKRGVKVRVIIDSLGNVENFKHLVHGREIYQFLEAGGVELVLYKDPKETGLANLIEAIGNVPGLLELTSPAELQNPALCLEIFTQIVQVARGETEVASEVRDQVATALEQFLKVAIGEGDSVEISTGELLRGKDTLFIAKLIAEMNHRWHEKYLIVDGEKAVLGGMNISDEYMLGGTGRMASNLGVERPAWRDTDVYLEGEGAKEAYELFARNWKDVRDEDLPEAPTPVKFTAEEGGGPTVQVLQHRPRLDGDHNITNFMVESLKSLKAGEVAWVDNAYFLPTGALTVYKKALMEAAQRGVDVRIVTNGITTTDGPQINQAAIFPYRELLQAGVRIFERTGDRCMHTKAAVFGKSTSTVGSWNADNRSASLNSENTLVVYDEGFASEVRAMILADMAPEVAVELHYEEIAKLPFDEETRNATVSLLSDFL